MIRVIYFNHWFSAITPVVEDLKKTFGNSVQIIASSHNENHTIKNSVDKFIVEDTDCDYVDTILNICKDNNVDLFFVRKNAKLIANRRTEFEAIGVKLILEDNEAIELTTNKAKTYEFFKESGLEHFIPFFVNPKNIKDNNILEGMSLEDTIKASGSFVVPNLCMKLVTDEGGCSFRKIENDNLTMQSLSYYRVNKATKDEVIKFIRSGDTEIEKLMFMEYLDEPEISVDCYNSKKGFIAIARKKTGSRVEELYYDTDLYNICNKICEMLQLKFPFNVQFRVKHGGDSNCIMDLRLLEINLRISGGMYLEVAHGLNICELCMKDNLDETDYGFDKYVNFERKLVTHVEKAVKI